MDFLSPFSWKVLPAWTDSGYLVYQEPLVPSVLEGLAVQGSLLNGAVTCDLVSVDEPGQ